MIWILGAGVVVIGIVAVWVVRYMRYLLSEDYWCCTRGY